MKQQTREEKNQNEKILMAIGKSIFARPISFVLPYCDTNKIKMDWCLATDEKYEDETPFIISHFVVKGTEYLLGATWLIGEAPSYTLIDETHEKMILDFTGIKRLMRELKMRFGTPVKYGSKA